MMTFEQFFEAATGHAPYDYQQRLAGGDAGRACESQLINVPTGLGKTAAVVLAWLWNRIQIRNPKSEIRNAEWPRRLVYCLPMRTLVEQTRDNVAEWFVRLAYAATPAHESVAKAAARLSKEAQGRLKQDDTELRRYTRELDAARNDLLWLVEHSPVVLMGGEELEQAKREWDLYPERPGILIGTQDMLLSRALNRGYGMSRYRWPMHFGLLNNDALWVLDETQLMGVGVETSAQLDGFRHKTGDSVVGACPTWWMSATLDAERLATVDHPKPGTDWPDIQLGDADRAQLEVGARLHARKPLALARTKLTSETNKAYARDLAAFVKEKHVQGTRTLVVVNTVARAREVFAALRKLGIDENRLALVHSRFRAADRAVQQAKLLAEGDRIVVATQAVEAGVDVSARLLVTELAPWSSLVQRFGRCNRSGEFPKEAQIAWVDIQPKDEKDELALPYDAVELKAARDELKTLDNASPESLQSIKVSPRRVVRPVLRRKDLLDLFDTTPDLAGHDLDISRYIRDGEDTDVQVFWRNLRGVKPSPDQPEASRPELCRVSLSRFRDFLGDLKKARDKQKGQSAVLTAYTWDALEERWDPATRVHAGGTYLLDVRAGGYSSELGWTGELADLKQESSWVKPLAEATRAAPARGYGGNESSFLRSWVSLTDHTRHVEEQTDALLSKLAAGGLLKESCVSALRIAVRWHDLGKAHAAFQSMLVAGDEDRRGTLWAKSQKSTGRRPRRHFRHELGSALAWLQAGPVSQPERDLIAYLIAAHHGKVRLSIRSLPGEEPPDAFAPDTRIARGILDGDEIPAQAFIALHLDAPSGPGPLKLDLGFMEMGSDPARGSSWLARMIGLRDRLGPFPLAWLETLLRAADGRASAAEVALAKPADSTGISSDVALRENAPPLDSTIVLSADEQSLVADLVADGLSIQDKFRPEPLYRETGKGHYASQTVEEIRQAKKTRRSKGKP
jgi:CRISPR-associated endonuclease/helicase Cas3